jgi:hypothetical protein
LASSDNNEKSMHTIDTISMHSKKKRENKMHQKEEEKYENLKSEYASGK